MPNTGSNKAPAATSAAIGARRILARRALTVIDLPPSKISPQPSSSARLVPRTIDLGCGSTGSNLTASRAVVGLRSNSVSDFGARADSYALHESDATNNVTALQ